MSTQSPFSVGAYLRSRRGSRIDRLLEHAAWLAELTGRIRQQLPPDLADHCEVVDYKDNRLTLLTRSPVWAARLRFATADLAKRFATDANLKIRRIDVRVAPAERPREANGGHHPAYLSSANARLLQQTAKGMKDKKLANALSRLAARGNAGKPE